MSNLLLKFYPYLTTFLGITLIIAFFIIFYDFTKPFPDPIQIINSSECQASDNTEIIEDKDNKDSTDKLTIYLSGAVQNPGEYQLIPGSIVYDAITMAGGLKDTANLVNSQINTSGLITDQMSIYIPGENDQTTSNTPAFITDMDNYSNNSNNSNLININTADKTKLMELTGVGEVTAQKIIDYRSSNPFDNIEEIMEVKGIGEKSFAKIKDQITT